MSVELRPMGVHCNIACQYCYQNPIRDAGNVSVTYDMDRMKRGIEAEGGPFTVFGGEPLLMPIDDLEDLFQWGFKTYGANAIQTNGTLVSDAHLALFRRWNVDVGVSVDGPDSLNDARWVSNLDKTREATEKTHAAIERMCAEGLIPSIIITLHTVNGSAETFSEMCTWILDLEQLGVTTVRLHVLEVDGQDIAAKYQMSEMQQIACFRRFKVFQTERLTTLKFDIFDEIRGQLVADDALHGCVWHACDPLTTKAVRGVEGQGQRSNCGRTNKDGIEYVKSATEGYERYVALYNTPYEHHGCGGCRFFLACKGQCPGTSQNGDWRNRSESCQLWFTLLEDAERDLLAEGQNPISQHPRRKHIEAALVQHWKRGQNPTLEHLVNTAAPTHPLTQEWVFARFSWTSDRAQAVWQPIMYALRRDLIHLRRAAVVEGIYDSAHETIPIQSYRQFADAIEDLGLSIMKTQILVLTDRQLFLEGNSSVPLAVRVVFGNAADAQGSRAIESSHRWLDKLAPLTTPLSSAPHELSQHWSTNPFWTLLGLDLMPSPHEDVPTIETQNALLDLGKRTGLEKQLQQLSEILSWPIEWSILHGIGQLQTPIMRIIHDIAPTAEKRVLRWAGDLLPLEAAQSHGFAFRQPKRHRIIDSSTYLRGLREIGRTHTDSDPTP